jgi:hypothetical protein
MAVPLPRIGNHRWTPLKMIEETFTYKYIVTKQIKKLVKLLLSALIAGILDVYAASHGLAIGLRVNHFRTACVRIDFPTKVCLGALRHLAGQYSPLPVAFCIHSVTVICN